MASPERTSPAFLTVLILLIGALVVGAALVTMLATRRPNTTVRFEVSQPVGSQCPEGTGAPACFRVDVRNTGSADAVALCSLESASGTRAAFANDASALNVLVPAGDTQNVIVHVNPTAGNSVAAPAVRCT